MLKLLRQATRLASAEIDHLDASVGDQVFVDRNERSAKLIHSAGILRLQWT